MDTAAAGVEIVAASAEAESAIAAAAPIVTSSLCVGTPAGSQFASAFQLPDAPPAHVFAPPAAAETTSFTVCPSPSSVSA